MITLTGTSSPADLTEPTSLDSPGIDLPETFIDGNAADMKVSLTEFLNEQRAIVDSEVQQTIRSIVYLQSEVTRKKAILTMIDDHLAELAQPVEPGQEVQS